MTSDSTPLPNGIALGAWYVRRNSTPYPDKFQGRFVVNHEGYSFRPDDIRLAQTLSIAEDWDRVARAEWGDHEVRFYDADDRFHHFRLFAGGVEALDAPSGLSVVVSYFRHVQAHGKTVPTYGQLKVAVAQDAATTTGKKGCLIFMPIVFGAPMALAWLIARLLT